MGRPDTTYLRILAAITVIGMGAVLGLSCTRPPSPSRRSASLPSVMATAAVASGRLVQFTDVTHAAGIHFVQYSGGFGKTYFPETMGAGCAWIDYDNSGRQSLLLLNETHFPGHPDGRKHPPALYRNNGDGTFTDVTRAAGLDIDIYAMGVAVGDYDNDGYPDIFLTSLNGNRLFHNRGDGTFEDVTVRSGIRGPDRWSTSAAFVDYDNDGLLDIFVCYYVQWSRKDDHTHQAHSVERVNWNPALYAGQTSRLFHNLGHGRFEDVTQEAGVAKEGKGLGVSIIMQPDGWPDLYVANDTVPNFYFQNHHDGTFTEEGLHNNVAVAEDGIAKNGMGTDAGDLTNDGGLEIVATNMPGQEISLYKDTGHSRFIDIAARAGVGSPSRMFSGFGAFFLDYDLDGYPDILVATGHPDPRATHFHQVEYAERPLLFHNQHDGTFREVSQLSGDLRVPMVARGAAWADFDGDGWPDVAITTSHGPAHLYRNNGGTGNHALMLTLVGTRCNRSAIGAQVYVTGSGMTQHQWVKSGSSYCSQSQLPLLFGLGSAPRADHVEVQWPGSATREELGPLPSGTARIVQGQGVVDQHVGFGK